jgi:hypothetical protein
LLKSTPLNFLDNTAVDVNGIIDFVMSVKPDFRSGPVPTLSLTIVTGADIGNAFV